MTVKLNGITRIVICIGKYAFKIPNFRYSHKHFLQGCLANAKERDYFKNHKYKGGMVDYVSPSLFCSTFGLIQIQYRCFPKKEDLTKKEKEFFKPLCGLDNKKENSGYYKNKLVCLDYE